MSGLGEEQLSKLENHVAGLLRDPRDKGDGRSRELTLREGASRYLRIPAAEHHRGYTSRYLRRGSVDDIAVIYIGLLSGLRVRRQYLDLQANACEMVRDVGIICLLTRY
jgi:hypothetical protein